MSSDFKIEIDGREVGIDDFLFEIPYPSSCYEEQVLFQEKVKGVLKPSVREEGEGPVPEPTPVYMLAPGADLPSGRRTAFVEVGHVTAIECPALPSPLFCQNRTVELWPRPMRVKLYLSRKSNREIVWKSIAEGAKFVVSLVGEEWVKRAYGGPIFALQPLPARPACVTCPPGKNEACNEEGQCLATGEEMPESSFGRKAVQSGADLIARERRRQVEKEGWTSEHDAQHTRGELAVAAICYAWPGTKASTPIPECWPWDPVWWKPSPNRIRNLVKAGALISAEIDRLTRKKDRP